MGAAHSSQAILSQLKLHLQESGGITWTIFQPHSSKAILSQLKLHRQESGGITWTMQPKFRSADDILVHTCNIVVVSLKQHVQSAHHLEHCSVFPICRLKQAAE
jgi:hypothetical protein